MMRGLTRDRSLIIIAPSFGIFTNLFPYSQTLISLCFPLSDMNEFWGLEVKKGESLKVSLGDGLVLHLSQASLGKLKDNRRKENVNLFVHVDGKKLVLGTLITNKLPQFRFDLSFDRDFEVSHNWKSGSVYLYGYKASKSSEDEVFKGESGKTDLKVEKESDAGTDLMKIAETHKDLNTQEDEETTFEDLMSDNDDKDDSQVETSKKRPLEPVEFATVTTIPEKRAKGPEGTDDNKAAPLNENDANKAPTNQPKQKMPKIYPCKTCNKLFATERAVEHHTKDTHVDVMQS